MIKTTFLLTVFLLLVLTTASACGNGWPFGEGVTPTPVPKWSALDAKVRLRDYLISTGPTEIVITRLPRFWRLKTIAALDEWQVVYEG